MQENEGVLSQKGLASVLKAVLKMVIARQGRSAALTDVDTLACEVNIYIYLAYNLLHLL